LIWERVEPESLATWIQQQQQGHPAAPWLGDAYELMHPDLVAENLLRTLWNIDPAFDAFAKVRRHSGGIDVRLDDAHERYARDFIFKMLDAASTLDNRKALRLEDLYSEEGRRPDSVRSSVAEEYWLFIDGIRPVGPGGRVTYYRSARLLEIAFHVRIAPVSGVWRDPDIVAAEVLAAYGGAIGEGERLQAMFGYYEASMSVLQTLMRPVFVTMVDKLDRSDGPRWRLSSVHAATEISEVALTAGLYPASDDAYRGD
jgi:hypothetical protein